MLDNLALLAGLIVILWLVAFGIYFFTTRQQRALEQDLSGLQQLLDEEERDEPY